MKIFATRVWGFNPATWPVITFGLEGNRDRLLKESEIGDCILFVGTQNAPTDETERGRLLGIAQIGRIPVETLSVLAESAISHNDYDEHGNFRWPKALAMTRAWAFPSKPLLKDVLAEQLPYNATTQAVLLTDADATAVMGLPGDEITIPLSEPIENLRVLEAALSRGNPTRGVVPVAWSGVVTRTLGNPSVTYAMRYGATDCWKIGHTVDSKQRISVAAWQSMFAPEDLSRRDLVSGDQLYAGWLYGSVGMVSDTGKTLDNVVLTLGVVGPASLAEPTQKFVHKLTDSPQPNGWDNQLKNEPGIMLTYERKWRSMYEISPFGLSVDATPHVGVNLGNINTDASVGATFRLGYDLPADYGPPRIRPSLPGSDFFVPTEELGGYLFTTIGERAVARNIFLDGNTFSDSPSVDKKNFVTSLQVGAAVTYGETRLSYTQVFMTKEYDTQKHPSVFGTLTLSHRF